MLSKRFLLLVMIFLATPLVSLASGSRCEHVFNLDLEQLDYITSNPAARELKQSYDLILKLKNETGHSIESLVTRYKQLNFIFNPEFKVPNSIKTTLELSALSLTHKLSADGIAKFLVLIEQNFQAKTSYKVPFRVHAKLAEYGLKHNFTSAKIVNDFLVELNRAQLEGPQSVYDHSTPFDQALQSFK